MCNKGLTRVTLLIPGCPANNNSSRAVSGLLPSPTHLFVVVVLLVELLVELRALLLVGLQVLLGLPVRRGELLMGRGELLNINLTRTRSGDHNTTLEPRRNGLYTPRANV